MLLLLEHDSWLSSRSYIKGKNLKQRLSMMNVRDRCNLTPAYLYCMYLNSPEAVQMECTDSHELAAPTR